MRISDYAHGLYVILNDESGAPLSTLQCAIGLQETRAFIAVGGHAMSIDSIIISATTCVVCYRTAGFCRDSGLVTTYTVYGQSGTDGEQRYDGSKSETDHRVLLLSRCVTSPGFLDDRGETLGRVLLNCRARHRFYNSTSMFNAAQ